MILSGSGEYSSSIETVASSIPRPFSARKYGGKSTTPRPAGRSPWTLPSQSEMCTCATPPRSRSSADGGCVALVVDPLPLADVDVERVGEDVDRVEADLLGHPDAEGGVAPGWGPRGVDQAEFHGTLFGRMGSPQRHEDAKGAGRGRSAD